MCNDTMYANSDCIRAVGTCTVERMNPAALLREKTIQRYSNLITILYSHPPLFTPLSCEELCSGIRARMADLHKLISDKEQVLVSACSSVTPPPPPICRSWLQQLRGSGIVSSTCSLTAQSHLALRQGQRSACDPCSTTTITCNSDCSW